MSIQKVMRKPGVVTEAQQLKVPADFPACVQLSVLTSSGQWQPVKDGDWIFPEPAAPGRFYGMDDKTFQKIYDSAPSNAKVDVPMSPAPSDPAPLPDVPASSNRIL